MNNIIQKIVLAKKKRVDDLKEKISLKYLEKKCIDRKPNNLFSNILKKNDDVKIIAEFKRVSPSVGLINDLDPVLVSRIYEEWGASAISVLTEEDYFQGNLTDLDRIKKTVNIPVLRKDFIIDIYQIFESYVNGADAILLIAGILDKKKLKDFLNIARDICIDVMVEVHSKEELNIVLDTSADIIGINNRNLKSFKVDLQTTEKLALLIPNDKIVVSESGFKSADDILLMKKTSINAVLIGEHLMKAPKIGEELRKMVQAGKK